MGDPSTTSTGLLASSPSVLGIFGDVFQSESENDRPAYSMTNKGIQLEAHLLPTEDPTSGIQSAHVDDTFQVPLQCTPRENPNLRERD
jgi:hypothetical protein